MYLDFIKPGLVIFTSRPNSMWKWPINLKSTGRGLKSHVHFGSRVHNAESQALTVRIINSWFANSHLFLLNYLHNWCTTIPSNAINVSLNKFLLYLAGVIAKNYV